MSNNLKYIIPSIGRCASSAMAHQIYEAVGGPYLVYRQAWDASDHKIIKTHAPFEAEPDFPYRAVFCWGPIGDIIASMYRGMYGHLLTHLKHLGISKADRMAFKARQDVDAWVNLIQGDRFGFKTNLLSWEQSAHTLFVHYQDWERDPAAIFRRVSQHLGVRVPRRHLHERQGHLGDLPMVLQEAIRQEYGELT